MSKLNGIKKMQLKKMRELVAIGYAQTVENTVSIPKPFVQIGYSMGTKGLNGAMFRSEADNKIYVYLIG